MSEYQIQDVNWWHESLINWLMVNPDCSLGEAAEFFQKSRSWLSVVMRSDIFRARLAECFKDNRVLMARTTAERLGTITDITLDAIEEKIEEERENLSLSQLHDTAELVLKAQGYTARSPIAVQVNAPSGDVNINTVSPNVLGRARDRAQQLEKLKVIKVNEAIEVEAVPVPTTS